MAGLEELSPETKAALDEAQFILEIDTKRHPDWIELPDGTRYVEERTTKAHAELSPVGGLCLVCDTCREGEPVFWSYCPHCGARRIDG